jgi:general secretion pathway protein G
MAMSVRSSAREGFSLLEIMIAITILGVVMAMVVPNVYSALARAKINTTKTVLKSLSAQIELYQVHTNQLPKTLKDLIKVPQDDQIKRKWEGPYLKPAEMPVDAWDHTFSYKVTPGGKHPYELLSYGPNGKGSPKEEHISVWDNAKKEK